MDKVEIIDGLQVLNTYDRMSINEKVVDALEDTIDDYYDLMKNPQENQLDISPLDYFQWENGVLIKKESENEFVNTYRYETYEYLCNKYSKKRLDDIFYVVNTSNSWTYIDKMLENIYDIWDLEMLQVLVYIESEFIWKSRLYNHYLSKILNDLVYNESAKVLWLFLYEKVEYRKSYEFISKIKETNHLILDKDLLSIYIILNKVVNNDEWTDNLLELYSNIISKEYDKWTIDDEKFKEDLSFVFSNYIDFYLKFSKNYDNLIQSAEQAIILWDETANYHLIYWYIQKGDLLNATHVYNKWRWYKKNKKSFLWKNPINSLEEFYLYWCELWIIGATELLIKFYREEFEYNWYNEDYFEKILFYSMDWEYDFSEKDNIFFECFNKYVDWLDNEKKLFWLIDLLFDKYIETWFALYLDKILWICSKILRWWYSWNIELKRKVAIWIEKMAVIDATRDQAELWDTLDDEYLKQKVALLSDLDYLDARFDELLLIMCVHNLQYVNTYSKILSIPTSLASIFDYFGMYNESNLALQFDEFFQKNNIQNSITKKTQILN